MHVGFAAPERQRDFFMCAAQVQDSDKRALRLIYDPRVVANKRLYVMLFWYDKLLERLSHQNTVIKKGMRKTAVTRYEKVQKKSGVCRKKILAS